MIPDSSFVSFYAHLRINSEYFHFIYKPPPPIIILIVFLFALFSFYHHHHHYFGSRCTAVSEVGTESSFRVMS